jgi:hypothetical protein
MHQDSGQVRLHADAETGRATRESERRYYLAKEKGVSGAKIYLVVKWLPPVEGAQMSTILQIDVSAALPPPKTLWKCDLNLPRSIAVPCDGDTAWMYTCMLSSINLVLV